MDWLNSQVQAGRDPNENARPFYDKAVGLYVKCPQALDAKHPRRDSLSDFNDVEIKLLSGWLAENQGMFDVLQQGAERKYCWSEYSGDVSGVLKYSIKTVPSIMDSLMKSLVGYRKVAYAVMWRSNYRAYNGRIEEALSDCILLSKLGDHMQGNGLLVEQLIGVAIEALGIGQVLELVERPDVPVDTLGNIRNQIEIEYSKSDAVITLEAEKVFWYDLIQHGFTDDGKGNGRVLKDGAVLVVADWKDALWKFVSFSYPDRQQVTGIIDNYFYQAGRLQQTTPWQLHLNDQTENWERMLRASYLLRMLGPAHDRIAQLCWRLRAHRKAMLTALAVLHYKKENAGYPADLAELVSAGYMKTIPIDPYSEKPLVYRKKGDNFLLYSIGRNFIDDGGEVAKDEESKIRKWADEGDWVFWPVQKN